MSAITAENAPTGGHSGQEESKFHVFVQVAMLLAVITGIEIVVIYLPMPSYVVMSILAVMSLVKFMFVIFIFMHLKWDKLFCTVMFFIGLVLATGTALSLYAIFKAEPAKPVGPAYETS